jgi:hypothetical protein
MAPLVQLTIPAQEQAVVAVRADVRLYLVQNLAEVLVAAVPAQTVFEGAAQVAVAA